VRELAPGTVRELAPGKVNLCLFLGPVRADGRHELVTVFESVSLCDELTLVVADEDEVVCPGVEGPNLVAAALAGLRARGWAGPPVRIEVHKRIPVAAGMGGGSADAAAAMRLARELSPISEAALGELAAELGADVRSQLAPGLVLGTGAGDAVEPLAPLEPHAFVIVPQRARLSTAAVYREADRLGLPRDSLEGVRERVLAAGPRPPAELLVNDLQRASVSLCPEVARALEAVRDAGADRALVCGSGPTVAGLCWGEDAAARAVAISGQIGGEFAGATAVVPVSSPPSGKMVSGR
jgi:4-diphosphocytidyl-2-C-methyl-D-erythritol kinase